MLRLGRGVQTLLSVEIQWLSCRVERGATPRRLASELGSQANSMSAVPPLPSSMLRFSGQQVSQQPAEALPSPEQPEPVQFEEPVQSKPVTSPSQPANPPQQQQQEKQQTPPPASRLPAVAASVGAGAAVGMAAASAAKPHAAEEPNHSSKVSWQIFRTLFCMRRCEVHPYTLLQAGHML